MAEAICTLPAGVPERSLGWDVLAWSLTYICQPDGPGAGGGWRYTPEQARFVLWWYALDPTGRWLFHRGVLRRSKGWGKSPFVAALGLAELCGPVRFGGWAAGGERQPWRPEPYRAGEPLTVPVNAAWVQLAGVSEKQTVNTMSMVLAMCAESPIVEDYGLDLGLTRIYTAAQGRLEPITASAPTAEGARPTFVAEDETQWYTDSNGGAALDRVNRRNVGKITGGTARVLETTNAHAAGENSVAERSYEAWLAMRDGRARTTSLLYDSREAPGGTDLGDEQSLLEGLAAAYGNSTWVDLERIRDEVWDPSTPPEDSRRFYLNQIAASLNAWVTQPEWAACLDVAKVVADGDLITLGFDGSRGRARGVADATALVGCRVDDGHLFEIAVWEQPAGPAGDDWSVPEVEVEAAVAAAFNRYNVVGFFADPNGWDQTVMHWEAEYSRQLRVTASSAQHPIKYATNQPNRVHGALEQLHGAIVHGDLTHDGSFNLTRHVLNARRYLKPGARAGYLLGKEHAESARKVDAAYAAMLAWQARLEAVAAGVNQSVAFVPRRVR